MKKISIFFLTIILSSSILFADDKSDLGKNANAIVENYEVILNIIDHETASLKIKKEIQVLNENGDDNAIFADYYNKFKSIKSFNGKILDADHKIIDKIKFKDLNDKSLINDFSLYEDDRMKYYVPIQKKYPYFVEYEYEIEYNGILNLPTWQPVKSSNVSVKHATFKIIQNTENPLKYKLINIDEPNILKSEDNIEYNWEIKNFQARISEPLKLPYSMTTPTIYLAPKNFSFSGFEGNMSSWNELGKWIYNLIKGQDELPEVAIQEVKNLIKNDTSKLESAKKIYEYMQSRTRYVSIQEGIGGWQPINATTVHNYGYGDCKALTNYTKALLNIAGIKSYYAVIRAGLNEPDIIQDFPSNQFNHAILCVPINNDTIWLECTSQTAPFGYIGDFTGNKHALLITENGGKLVSTTHYTKEQNLQNRKILVDVQENGQADATIKTNYSGLQYENISHYVNESIKDQKEYLLKNLEINNFTIHNFAFGSVKNIDPYAYDSINITIDNFANISSSRMFFNLNMLNKSDYVPKKLDNRISPIKFSYPYTDIDSIEYNIPENYTIEYIPKDTTIANQFGSYSNKFIIKDNQITYVRKLSMNKDIFPADSYDELIKFFKAIVKFDKSKCVLKINSSIQN